MGQVNSVEEKCKSLALGNHCYLVYTDYFGRRTMWEKVSQPTGGGAVLKAGGGMGACMTQATMRKSITDCCREQCGDGSVKKIEGYESDPDEPGEVYRS